MKKSLFSMLCLLMSLPVFSQSTTLRDAWVNIPDSMMIYLNQSMRKDHLDFYDMGIPSEVKNKFEEICVMDTLTADYMSLKLNQNVDLQLKLLHTSDSSKSIICMVKTFRAPEAESEVRFFSTHWQPLFDLYGLPLSHDAESLIRDFTKCPSDMSAESYSDVCRQMEFVMLAGRWDCDNDRLVLTISVPAFSAQENDKVKSVVLQRNFKWNGLLFKEC